MASRPRLRRPSAGFPDKAAILAGPLAASPWLLTILAAVNTVAREPNRIYLARPVTQYKIKVIDKIFGTVFNFSIILVTFYFLSSHK